MRWVYSQYEDAEPNTHGASAPSNSYKIHDQHSSPEARLETVHGEEGSWLQGVSEEEDDSEYVDEQYDNNKQHEYHDRSGSC